MQIKDNVDCKIAERIRNTDAVCALIPEFKIQNGDGSFHP